MMTEKVRKIIVPKQKRGKQTKKRILDVATQIFAEKGLEGTRIDEIIHRSEVNKERIYAYYGSKKKLYQEVLLENYRRVTDDNILMNLDETAIPNLNAIIIDVYIDFHESHPNFWRLLSWENLSNGENLSDEQWSVLRGGYLEHLKGLYELGQKKGFFRKEINFNSYIFTVFSLTFFYFSNQITMSKLLGVDLKSAAVRQQIEHDIIVILSSGVAHGEHKKDR
ncbi:TetR/AcrR family transcriptional regulator [Vibrio kyushuensis]|uniref:TetR/AcrR family transcriptional regulator n=1 Tax=Vibrio kyushuensis TaxID=2910249 RepID=UPI003D153310